MQGTKQILCQEKAGCNGLDKAETAVTVTVVITITVTGYSKCSSATVTGYGKSLTTGSMSINGKKTTVGKVRSVIGYVSQDGEIIKTAKIEESER